MNEIEEEFIIVERNRNPKIVLGLFSIIILIAAIVLGVTLSDSKDSSTNSVINETAPSQEQLVTNDQDPVEVEADENIVVSPLEKGEVMILGDPIPVDPEIGSTMHAAIFSDPKFIAILSRSSAKSAPVSG